MVYRKHKKFLVIYVKNHVSKKILCTQIFEYMHMTIWKHTSKSINEHSLNQSHGYDECLYPFVQTFNGSITVHVSFIYLTIQLFKHSTFQEHDKKT